MVVDPSASVDGITQVVQSHVSDGKLDRSHGKELTYTLPIATVGNFPGRQDSLVTLMTFQQYLMLACYKTTWSSLIQSVGHL